MDISSLPKTSSAGIACTGRYHLLTALCLSILLLPSPALAGRADHRVYGFFDIEYEIGNNDESARDGTFDQHHLTLIRRAELDERYSFLFEASFEHGPSLSENALEGKVYLPKAYFEMQASDALQLRAGKFLPPFGIYNARHDATPTVLPTVLPGSVYGKHLNLSGPLAADLGQKVRAYPRFCTGIWLLGRRDIDAWELEYNLFLTNGRGAQCSERDDNGNKGLGTRVVITPAFGARLGFSYYRDRNGEVGNASQSAFGADIEYELGDFILEAAVIRPRFEKLAADGSLTGDFQNPLGFYLMAGYTFWGGTTLFGYYDRYDPDSDVSPAIELDRVLGINQQLKQSVFLKGEIHERNIESLADPSYRTFIASLAVAF